MNQVVLLGTIHTLQRENSEFSSYIEQLVDKYKIGCIAEEIDVPKPSSASELSEIKSITHLIIEPTPNEKIDLGIQDLNLVSNYLMCEHDFSSWPLDATEDQLPPGVWDKYEKIREKTHRLRENEWWRRIKEMNIWPCLVICGSSHFQPFKEQLIKHSVQVIEVDECWDNRT